ncbi:hypothetical protein [Paenibacillus ihumii]|nr:hypothetical protein [Paenibacillus ihumii]
MKQKLQTNELDHKLKKITITVNGEPIGYDLLLDNVTYVPVAKTHIIRR